MNSGLARLQAGASQIMIFLNLGEQERRVSLQTLVYRFPALHPQTSHSKTDRALYTRGQRAPEFGIELSSNMAPKTEIAGRRLVASFLHYKKRLLLHAGIPQKPDGMFL